MSPFDTFRPLFIYYDTWHNRLRGRMLTEFISIVVQTVMLAHLRSNNLGKNARNVWEISPIRDGK